MRAKKIFISLFVLTTLFLTYGCEDSGLVGTQQSNKDILTSTTWQVQKVIANSDNQNQPEDITNQFPFVYLTFNSNGTFTSSVLNGIWTLNNSGDKLIFNQNTSNQITADILEINRNILQIRLYYPVSSPPPLVEITFIPANLVINNSPAANFDTLWNEFDKRYSFFVIKNIDWNNLYSVYRPLISDTTSQYGLFQILSGLLNNLKDGHVNLKAPFATYSYTDWYAKYPNNFLGENSVTKYLSKDYGTVAGGYIRFGEIEDSIGYIYVGPNLLGNSDAWSSAIDAVINSLWNMKGIIVDIRGNTGGSEGLGAIVAGRFADKSRIYCYTRWRQGPGYNDFSDYQPVSISPEGPKQFLKPVTLLTNRHCFSSAEGTILMFRVLPNVTIIGDTTGGGSGNPIALQLPNGWTYSVSRWIQYTADKKIFEGIGISPDIPVQITQSDSVAERDAILEKAIELLKK
jgi:hypothetical protein